MTIVSSLLNYNRRLCWRSIAGLIKLNTSLTFQIRSNLTIFFRTYYTTNPDISPYKREENEYYHSYLAKNKKYNGTIAFLDYVRTEEPPSDISFLTKDFESQSAFMVMKDLHKALLHARQHAEVFNDEGFVKLCNTMILKVGELDEDNVLNLLKVLTLWDDSKRTGLFFDVCRSVDKLLVTRFHNCGFNRCLLAIDHFYRLQVIRFSDYAWQSMKRLWRDPNRLTSAQVIHSMFLVNAHRVWHPSVHMYGLECYLSQAIYELNTEECAIIALAFFKTKNRIRSVELLKLFYHKLEHRLSTIDSIPLTAFLKLFRFCHYLQLSEKLQQLLVRLGTVIDSHSYFCCTHIALLGTDLLVWHPNTFDKIAERFVKEISTIRLKDIERTILAFETFNYDPKIELNIYQVALDELVKRQEELEKYPREFYSAVSYLCIKGYYNQDLIDKIISEDFIKKVFKKKVLNKHNVNRCVLVISNSVQIDCPDYKGALLSPALTKDLYTALTWKKPTKNDKRLSFCDQVLLEAESLLAQMFNGSDFVDYTYVLPHSSRPDIIFCMNGDKPVKLPESILTKTYIDIKIPSTAEDWYVLTFIGFNTTVYQSDELIGNTVAKIRHLNKIGYNVLLLKETEWNKKCEDGKKEYLLQLIEESKQSKRYQER